MTSSSEARITLVTETNARDGFGNITQQTTNTVDAPTQSRTTQTLWGELDGANQVSAANGRFPIRVTNALGHQEYREYDARTGAMQRLYGPNGLNTSWIIDGLGRVMKETRADGTTTSTYTLLQVVVSDPLGHTSTTLRNVRGETIKTWDAAGTVTDYTYDAAGNLKQVQVAGNGATQITNSYNIRGFKTAMVDPDTGAWSYQYNAFGELLSQLDAKGQTTTLAYDALGRVSTKSAPEGASTWSYDAAWKGVGQLASLASAEGLTQSFSYDSYSRPLVRTYPVSPDYPSGYKVRSGYNSHGHLAEVRNDLTN